ncbi:MAG: type II toxin-antitoxin system RelE/ParE family toxin [Aestuariivirga sp.]
MKDFRTFPQDVKSELGYALFVAQCGGRHRKAKTLKGAGDAGLVEIVDDYRGDTYRTVYTVRFDEAVYVLHAFQKKSKSGIATPKQDMRLIELRLRDAERLHKESSK